ncbi:MAG: ECF transporter S component [Lachnospiraceae bacterium]|nr:ECF transporter S component [Lachnospiraceae bacterium]MDY4970813.1 ECF transporter S component [Lachnospiraceae bacterium]
MENKKILSIRNLVQIGMFGALAAVLMLFEFPLPFIAPSFYELDLSEIPVLIGTFSMGPIAGVLIELIKILLKLVLKGTSTAYVGDVANFVIGCFFLLPAGIIYKLKKTKKGAVLGMSVGTLIMAAAGAVMNAYVLLPFYSRFYGMPMEALIAAGTEVNSLITSIPTFVLVAVVPFNLIKGIIVSLITYLVYKRVRVIIH